MCHGSCTMGHGSILIWVTGSRVTSSDPLPALITWNKNTSATLKLTWYYDVKAYKAEKKSLQARLLSVTWTLTAARDWLTAWLEFNGTFSTDRLHCTLERVLQSKKIELRRKLRMLHVGYTQNNTITINDSCQWEKKIKHACTLYSLKKGKNWLQLLKCQFTLNIKSNSKTACLERFYMRSFTDYVANSQRWPEQLVYTI